MDQLFEELKTAFTDFEAVFADDVSDLRVAMAGRDLSLKVKAAVDWYEEYKYEQSLNT